MGYIDDFIAAKKNATRQNGPTDSLRPIPSVAGPADRAKVARSLAKKIVSGKDGAIDYEQGTQAYAETQTGLDSERLRSDLSARGVKPKGKPSEAIDMFLLDNVFKGDALKVARNNLRIESQLPGVLAKDTKNFWKDPLKGAESAGRAVLGSLGIGGVNLARNLGTFTDTALNASDNADYGPEYDALAKRSQELQDSMMDPGADVEAIKAEIDKTDAQMADIVYQSDQTYSTIARDVSQKGSTQKALEPTEERLTRWADVENNGEVVKLFAGAAQSVPQSLIVGVPYVGSAMFFASAYQGAFEQQVDAGVDPKTATNYAIGSAFVETGSERLFNVFGGTVGVGKAAKQGLIKGPSGMMDHFMAGWAGGAERQGFEATYGNWAKYILKKASEEGAEEIAADFGNAGIAALVNAPPQEITFGGLMTSFLTGAIAGGGMSAANTTLAFAKTRKAVQRYAENDVTIRNPSIEQAVIDDFVEERESPEAQAYADEVNQGIVGAMESDASGQAPAGNANAGSPSTAGYTPAGAPVQEVPARASNKSKAGRTENVSIENGVITITSTGKGGVSMGAPVTMPVEQYQQAGDAGAVELLSRMTETANGESGIHSPADAKVVSAQKAAIDLAMRTYVRGTEQRTAPATQQAAPSARSAPAANTASNAPVAGPDGTRAESALTPEESTRSQTRDAEAGKANEKRRISMKKRIAKWVKETRSQPAALINDYVKNISQTFDRVSAKKNPTNADIQEVEYAAVDLVTIADYLHTRIDDQTAPNARKTVVDLFARIHAWVNVETSKFNTGVNFKTRENLGDIEQIRSMEKNLTKELQKKDPDADVKIEVLEDDALSLQMKSIRKLFASLGFNAEFFEMSTNTTKAEIKLHEYVYPEKSNNIYVNINFWNGSMAASSAVMRRAAAHGFLHMLTANAKTKVIYQNLLKAFRKSVSQEDYDNYLLKMGNSGIEGYTDSLIERGILHEEMLADVMGDAFLEEEFWQGIKEQSKGTDFEAIADEAIAFIRSLPKVKGLDVVSRDNIKYIHDAFLKMIAKVAGYAKMQDKPSAKPVVKSQEKAPEKETSPPGKETQTDRDINEQATIVPDPARKPSKRGVALEGVSETRYSLMSVSDMDAEQRMKDLGTYETPGDSMARFSIGQVEINGQIVASVETDTTIAELEQYVLGREKARKTRGAFMNSFRAAALANAGSISPAEAQEMEELNNWVEKYYSEKKKEQMELNLAKDTPRRVEGQNERLRKDGSVIPWRTDKQQALINARAAENKKFRDVQSRLQELDNRMVEEGSKADPAGYEKYMKARADAARDAKSNEIAGKMLDPALGVISFVTAYNSVDMSEYIQNAMRNILKSYSRLKSGGAKQATPKNRKTIMSLDPSTLCLMKDPNIGCGRACLYCYVELPRLRKKRGKGNLSNPVGEFVVIPFNEEMFLKTMTPEFVTVLNGVGGLRMFSAGDYHPIASGEQRDSEGKLVHKVDEIDAMLTACEKLTGVFGEPLMVKAITKQAAFVKKYGHRTNLRMNISADFWYAEAYAIPEGVKVTAQQRRESEAAVRALSTESYYTIALGFDREKVRAIKAEYPNARCRYVALNAYDYIKAIFDPDIDVVTAYHGETDVDEMMGYYYESDQNPKPGTEAGGEKGLRLVDHIGEDALRGIFGGWFQVKPNAYIKAGDREQVVNIDYVNEVMGRNAPVEEGKKPLPRITVEEFVQKALNRVCCETHKCASCATCCGFTSVVEKGINDNITNAGLRFVSAKMQGAADLAASRKMAYYLTRLSKENTITLLSSGMKQKDAFPKVLALATDNKMEDTTTDLVIDLPIEADSEAQEAANALVDDNPEVGRYSLGPVDGNPDIRVLGQAYTDFLTKGFVDVNNTSFETEAEMLSVLSKFRDQRYETNRWLFVDRHGVIQQVHAISAGLPGSTPNGAVDSTSYLLGAVKGALENHWTIHDVHNHPGGNPDPSESDYRSRKTFEALLRVVVEMETDILPMPVWEDNGYKSADDAMATLLGKSISVDHGHWAVIDGDGAYHIEGKYDPSSQDPLYVQAGPEMDPSGMLSALNYRSGITQRSNLAMAASKFLADYQNGISQSVQFLFMTSADPGNIQGFKHSRALVEMDPSLFKTDAGKAKAKRAIKETARRVGATLVVAFDPSFTTSPENSTTALVEMTKTGYLELFYTRKMDLKDGWSMVRSDVKFPDAGSWNMKADGDRKYFMGRFHNADKKTEFSAIKDDLSVFGPAPSEYYKGMVGEKEIAATMREYDDNGVTKLVGGSVAFSLGSVVVEDIGNGIALSHPSVLSTVQKSMLGSAWTSIETVEPLDSSAGILRVLEAIRKGANDKTAGISWADKRITKLVRDAIARQGLEGTLYESGEMRYEFADGDADRTYDARFMLGLKDRDLVDEKTAKFLENTQVVNQFGSPMKVYHGSIHKFATFDRDRLGETTGADSAKEGIFFTRNPRMADSYRSYRETPGVQFGKRYTASYDSEENGLEGLTSLKGAILRLSHINEVNPKEGSGVRGIAFHLTSMADAMYRNLKKFVHDVSETSDDLAERMYELDKAYLDMVDRRKLSTIGYIGDYPPYAAGIFALLRAAQSQSVRESGKTQPTLRPTLAEQKNQDDFIFAQNDKVATRGAKAYQIVADVLKDYGLSLRETPIAEPYMGMVYEAYLNIEKLWSVEETTDYVENFFMDNINYAKDNGYDGLVFRRANDYMHARLYGSEDEVYVVFDEKNIVPAVEETELEKAINAPGNEDAPNNIDGAMKRVAGVSPLSPYFFDAIEGKADAFSNALYAPLRNATVADSRLYPLIAARMEKGENFSAIYSDAFSLESMRIASMDEIRTELVKAAARAYVPLVVENRALMDTEYDIQHYSGYENMAKQASRAVSDWMFNAPMEAHLAENIKAMSMPAVHDMRRACLFKAYAESNVDLVHNHVGRFPAIYMGRGQERVRNLVMLLNQGVISINEYKKELADTWSSWQNEKNAFRPEIPAELLPKNNGLYDFSWNENGEFADVDMMPWNPKAYEMLRKMETTHVGKWRADLSADPRDWSKISWDVMTDAQKRSVIELVQNGVATAQEASVLCGKDMRVQSLDRIADDIAFMAVEAELQKHGMPDISDELTRVSSMAYIVAGGYAVSSKEAAKRFGPSASSLLEKKMAMVEELVPMFENMTSDERGEFLQDNTIEEIPDAMTKDPYALAMEVATQRKPGEVPVPLVFAPSNPMRVINANRSGTTLDAGAVLDAMDKVFYQYVIEDDVQELVDAFSDEGEMTAFDLLDMLNTAVTDENKDGIITAIVKELGYDGVVHMDPEYLHPEMIDAGEAAQMFGFFSLGDVADRFIPGRKTRKTYGSAMESPHVLETTKYAIQQLDLLYDVQSDEETVKLAMAMLDVDGVAACQMKAMDNSQLGAEITALRIWFAMKAQETGDVEQAVRWVEILATVGTSLGQTINAYKMIGRLTPTGVLMLANRELTSGVKPSLRANLQQQSKDLGVVLNGITADGIVKLTPRLEQVIRQALSLPNTAKIIDRVNEVVSRGNDAETNVVFEFVNNMRRNAVDAGIDVPNSPDPVVFLKDVFARRDVYKEAMDKTHAQMGRLYTRSAEALMEIDAYFAPLTGMRYTKSGLSRAFNGKFSEEDGPGVTSRGMYFPKFAVGALGPDFNELKDLIRAYYLDPSAGTNLVQALVSRGVKIDDANAVAAAVKRELGKVTREARKNAIINVNSKARKSNAQDLLFHIIDMADAGMMTDTSALADLAQMADIPVVDAALAARLMAHANTLTAYQRAIDARGTKATKAERRAMDIESALIISDIRRNSPVPIGRRIALFHSMCMLLAFLPAIRNVAGNVAFGGLDMGVDQFAAMTDWMYSKATKRARSTPRPQFGAYFKGALTGAKEGLTDVMLDIDTAWLETGMELPTTHVFKSKVGHTLERSLRILLGFPDRIFQTASYEAYLAGAMKMANATEETTQMVEDARVYAARKTFVDKNYLSKSFSGFKKTLNGGLNFGVGDFVIKFPRVPGALLMRTLEYTPISFLRALGHVIINVAENAGAGTTGKEWGVEKRKKVVALFSQGLIGTMATLGVGALLRSVGLLFGKEPDDQQEREMLRSMGVSGSYLINGTGLLRWLGSGFNPEAAKIQKGDTLLSYSWAAPLSLGISVGANIYDVLATTEKAQGDAVLSAVLTIGSSVDTLMDLSVMSGIKNFMNYEGFRFVASAADSGYESTSTIVESMANLILSAPASFVPILVRESRLLLDNTDRSTRTSNAAEYVINLIQNKIPIWSRDLPAKHDIFGNEKQLYTGGTPDSAGTWMARTLDVFMNPAALKVYKPSDASILAMNIMAEQNAKDLRPVMVARTITYTSDGITYTFTLSESERQELQEAYGQAVQTAYGRLNPAMPMEQRVFIMGGILDKATSETRLAIVKRYSDKMLAEGRIKAK